jgi:hypothetical protein
MHQYPDDNLQIDAYLEDMKQCINFQRISQPITYSNQIFKSVTINKTAPKLLYDKQSTRDGAICKHIKANFPIATIKESLLNVPALYDAKEGLGIEDVYELIEDERLVLLKVCTLTLDYIELECTVKNGLFWCINNN